MNVVQLLGLISPLSDQDLGSLGPLMAFSSDYSASGHSPLVPPRFELRFISSPKEDRKKLRQKYGVSSQVGEKWKVHEGFSTRKSLVEDERRSLKRWALLNKLGPQPRIFSINQSFKLSQVLYFGKGRSPVKGQR